MATEKRLIDANALVDQIIADFQLAVWDGADSTECQLVLDEIEEAPTVDAVEVVLFNALKSLVNGEWVDCKLVQEALSIDFATGLKMFDFSRTAEWNPAPLNGQKITTKFMLKNAVVHGRWEDGDCTACGFDIRDLIDADSDFRNWVWEGIPYCPNCGAKMDGDGNA